MTDPSGPPPPGDGPPPGGDPIDGEGPIDAPPGRGDEGGGTARRGRVRSADWGTFGTAIGAGLLLALSLPPWGFWPLALPGIVLLDRLIEDRPWASRFRRGWLVGLALLGPTMAWMKELTAPGYLIAVAFFAAGVGLAMVACPPGRGRHLALPAAWLLAEAFRSSFPFGGVPISLLAVGQVAGPLAGVARVGGVLLLGAVTVTAGVAVAAALERRWTSAGAAAAVVVVVVLVAAVAPQGHDTGRSVSMAYVQGGGPQGTRAIDTDPRDVFDRHMRASARVREGVDVTLWPEDVVDTSKYVVDTQEGDELAALAREKGTTLIAGVVEDEGRTQFHNASMAWDPTGTVVDRYEKVHRVPFGEFVPLRSLLEPLAGDSLPQRDAHARVRAGDAAHAARPDGGGHLVEVFFGHRARDGVRHGGEIVLNPTNGSSFTGTLVQTQQVASSRLRAIENGRWVVQAAPTGFSAFVTPSGTVLERTRVGEAAVAEHRVALRQGFTIYTRVGDRPYVYVALALLVAAWALALRRPMAADEDGPAATPA